MWDEGRRVLQTLTSIDDQMKCEAVKKQGIQTTRVEEQGGVTTSMKNDEERWSTSQRGDDTQDHKNKKRQEIAKKGRAISEEGDDEQVQDKHTTVLKEMGGARNWTSRN